MTVGLFLSFIYRNVVLVMLVLIDTQLKLIQPCNNSHYHEGDNVQFILFVLKETVDIQDSI